MTDPLELFCGVRMSGEGDPEKWAITPSLGVRRMWAVPEISKYGYALPKDRLGIYFSR